MAVKFSQSGSVIAQVLQPPVGGTDIGQVGAGATGVLSSLRSVGFRVAVGDLLDKLIAHAKRVKTQSGELHAFERIGITPGAVGARGENSVRVFCRSSNQRCNGQHALDLPLAHGRERVLPKEIVARSAVTHVKR